MPKTHGYAVPDPKARLGPFTFDRRELLPADVRIDIQFCGICHSDIHQVRGEWGNSTYPMVPGHEIVGRVSAVGSAVRKFKVGDLAGVGCMVDSCRTCPNCREGLEQYCDNHIAFTYNSTYADGTMTFGGYSNAIVVDEAYGLKVSPTLNLAAVAPLLCAGITTYSPMKHWGVGKGQRVGVVGLGGLGHMAVKFGHAFGAHVTQFTTSPGKEADAKRLGADEVVYSREPANLAKLANSFDFIIDTVSAPHDVNAYLNMLKRDRTMVLVGVPEKPLGVAAFSILGKRRGLAGSNIGGIAETQEMLDYCADHGVVSDIEMVDIKDVNEAYERVLKSDVKYRFVIDMATLAKG